MCLPVHSTVHKLLRNRHSIIFSIDTRERRNRANCLPEESISSRQDIGLVNNREMLMEKIINISKNNGNFELTFRGLEFANSNAIWPILREAYSVMSLVARASFPFFPSVNVSSLTYCKVKKLGYACI